MVTSAKVASKGFLSKHGELRENSITKSILCYCWFISWATSNIIWSSNVIRYRIYPFIDGSSIGGMVCHLSKYCRWSDQQRLSIVNTAIGIPVYALSSLIVIGSCCHQQAHHLPRHLWRPDLLNDNWSRICSPSELWAIWTADSVTLLAVIRTVLWFWLIE